MTCRFLVLLAVLLLPGLIQAEESTVPTYTLQTPYHTEEQWVVSSICRNIFELLSYAKDKKGEIVTPESITVSKAAGEGIAYEVNLRTSNGAIKTTLVFPASIWSSAAYVPFCQAVMESLKFAKPEADKAATGDPLLTLLDFTEATIEAENKRVSGLVTEDPSNAALQEQAALVLGALAMKENSGWFWDARDSCNHLTAHLAVARCLHPTGELAPEGRVAECLAGLIADTKAACATELDSLAKVRPGSAALDTWIRVGRVRNSRDWRLITVAREASGVEQVEYFRAICEAVDSDRAISWVKANTIPPRQDWNRLVMQTAFSVEAGHLYVGPSLRGETDLMQGIFPGRFQTKSFVNDLNELPEDVLVDSSGVRSLKIISSGAWAQFFQRNVLNSCAQIGYFLKKRWGVPERAEKFNASINTMCAGLDLFPYYQFVANHLCQIPDDPVAIANAFSKHPELACDFIYRLAPTAPEPNFDLAKFQKMVKDWFTPPLLSGTAYSVSSRLQRLGKDLAKDPVAVHRLFAIAPLQYTVARLELVTRYSDKPTVAQIREVFGSMEEYYMGVQRWLIAAPGLTFEEKVALRRKGAKLDPDSLFYLAGEYRQKGMEKESAETLQEWMDLATDRVAVSNQSDWLINYYYDHGEKDKAMALAKEAAEVYSLRGLASMMRLQEKMGNLAEAEVYGRRIKERYKDDKFLDSFYVRQLAKGEKRFQSKVDEISRTAFPDGMRKVTVVDLSGAPSKGVRLQGSSEAMTKAGLTSDLIIVALDGIEVKNGIQYQLVRGLSDSPEMKIIVWDGKAYREITANQPGRLFGTGLVDYAVRASPARVD